MSERWLSLCLLTYLIPCLAAAATAAAAAATAAAAPVVAVWGGCDCRQRLLRMRQPPVSRPLKYLYVLLGF